MGTVKEAYKKEPKKTAYQIKKERRQVIKQNRIDVGEKIHRRNVYRMENFREFDKDRREDLVRESQMKKESAQIKKNINDESTRQDLLTNMGRWDDFRVRREIQLNRYFKIKK